MLVAQSCPTLSDPTGCSPPGSSTHGIFQARVLEWTAIALPPSISRTFIFPNETSYLWKTHYPFPSASVSVNHHSIFYLREFDYMTYLKVSSLSRVQLFVTPWTVAHQAPQSVKFSRQEYWSELPFPSPGDLSNPGIKPRSSAWQADSSPSEPPEKTCSLKSWS